MSKLKVGVIGAGGIAQVAHIPSWQKSGKAEVVAVADINEIKLKDVQKRFDIPNGYTDWKELVARDDLDVISVCTPNGLHVEMAIEALNAGKHVLCEKPVATKGADAVKLMDVAAKSGKIFMGAFCTRFSPDAELIKRYIEAGELGEIYHAKAGNLRRRGVPGLGGWFTTKEKSGGGCMLDIGVHALDRVYWQIGSPEPVSVSGAVYQKFAGQAVDGGWPPANTRIGDVFDGTNDVEDMAIGTIRFANGMTLTVEASWAANLEARQYVQILGTKAGITHDDRGLRLHTTMNGDQVEIRPSVGSGDIYLNEVLHLVECIETGKPPRTTPEEIINVSYMIEGIYASAEAGREIMIAELKNK